MRRALRPASAPRVPRVPRASALLPSLRYPRWPALGPVSAPARQMSACAPRPGGFGLHHRHAAEPKPRWSRAPLALFARCAVRLLSCRSVSALSSLRTALHRARLLRGQHGPAADSSAALRSEMRQRRVARPGRARTHWAQCRFKARNSGPSSSRPTRLPARGVHPDPRPAPRFGQRFGRGTRAFARPATVHAVPALPSKCHRAACSRRSPPENRARTTHLFFRSSAGRKSPCRCRTPAAGSGRAGTIRRLGGR